MSSHSDSFVASGNSPTPGPDFEVQDEGSIFVLRLLTEEAWAWLDEHIPSDAEWFGKLIVEHRYIADIVAGIRNDGLAVH